ncbi:MAG: hypothetical protein HC912_02405 [Saprospiraceae bacterium]|nr:hypothetical protein [Saprospiraceae bacterium]
MRVVREDKKVKGLLYAGTEGGLYVSFNNGDKWEKMNLNLPICPITDLTIQDNDLVVATSGRAFWILDDLSAIQQSKGQMAQKLAIYIPKPTYKFNLNTPDNPPTGNGQNPMNGVIIDYFLPEKMDSMELKLDILDSNGELVRSYSSKKNESAKPYPGGPPADKVLIY